MDNSAQQKPPTKRSNKSKNKKPIKVVYISNPMKVNVTPSEFRALVQELTGQDAEFPTDLSRFQQNPDSDGGHQTSDSDNSVTKSTSSHESDHTLVMPQVDPNYNNNFEGQLGSPMEEFDPFDHHVFAPDQMMDDMSAFLPPSVFHEYPQAAEELRRFDAM